MIEGVMIKELVTHDDDRGFFREIIRATDDIFKEGFGQLSVSRVNKGVVKAWHLHKEQVDWFYVSSGLLKVALYDTRKESSTFKQTMVLLMGDGRPAQVLKVSAGVAHGYKCLKGPAEIFYLVSKVYDGKDEVRIPYDDPEINFDWTKD